MIEIYGVDYAEENQYLGFNDKGEAFLVKTMNPEYFPFELISVDAIRDRFSEAKIGTGYNELLEEIKLSEEKRRKIEENLLSRGFPPKFVGYYMKGIMGEKIEENLMEEAFEVGTIGYANQLGYDVLRDGILFEEGQVVPLTRETIKRIVG